jgi:hypothetical protein
MAHQLEKGVAVALELLKQHPAPELKRPPYPVYEWQKMRDGLALRAAGAPPSATSPVASAKPDR